ncbi:hypothetical protein MASR2M69_10410 [Bacteroidota bacterium]
MTYITETKLILKGNSSQVAGLSQERYLLEQMWTGRPKYDLFVINTFLERNALIKEGIDGDVRVSPAGKYLLLVQCSGQCLVHLLSAHF